MENSDPPPRAAYLHKSGILRQVRGKINLSVILRGICRETGHFAIFGSLGAEYAFKKEELSNGDQTENRGVVFRDRFFNFRLRSGHAEACECEMRLEGPLFAGEPDRLEGLVHLRCKRFERWAGFDSHPKNPRTAGLGKEADSLDL